jgi:hypothetical protein
MLNEPSISKLWNWDWKYDSFLLKCKVLEPVRKQYIHKAGWYTGRNIQYKIHRYVGRRSTSDIIGQLSAVLSNKTKRDSIIEDFEHKEKMKI